MNTARHRESVFHTTDQQSSRNPHRSRGWIYKSLAMLIIGGSVLSVPQPSYAGDDEDTLAQCIGIGVLLGGFPFMLGCAAGYGISNSSSDGTFPKFDFANKAGLPDTPLGKNALYYTYGNQERLMVGLWKGCPPDCLVAPELTPAREDVRSVTFYIVEAEHLGSAASFDDADWRYLGIGKYRRAKFAWEMAWDSSGHSASYGYVLRADFFRADGSVQTGIGLALPESAEPSYK